MSTIINEEGEIQDLARHHKANCDSLEWREANQRRLAFKNLSRQFEKMMIQELEIMARIEERECL